MSEEKSKAYEITKQVEIDDDLREKLQKLYKKRGQIDRLLGLERCGYMDITLGVLTDVKDKEDLKKKLYSLIEHEGCKSYYERDYDVYRGLEETPRHGLEVKCHYPKAVTVNGHTRKEAWVQFNAEEINLIEVEE